MESFSVFSRWLTILVPHDFVPHDFVPHDFVPHDFVPRIASDEQTIARKAMGGTKSWGTKSWGRQGASPDRFCGWHMPDIYTLTYTIIWQSADSASFYTSTGFGRARDH